MSRHLLAGDTRVTANRTSDSLIRLSLTTPACMNVGMVRLTDNGGGFAYALALGIGMGLWFWASYASGKREPWDDSSYWAIVYPLATAASGLLGYFFPMRPWRWALTLFVGQFLGMTIRNGEVGNLWPLGMLLFGVLALPGVFTAKIASRMRIPTNESSRGA
jgi:hypothetical protein